MASHLDLDITIQIIDKAKSLGTSLAGVASIAPVLDSPSHNTIYGKIEWQGAAGSMLVLALAHGEAEPELDWWDGEGGTPGDRRLKSVANGLREWLAEEFNINAGLLPYPVETGGIFLKDAAVVAGLGTIGMNNLLLTPEFGPRVRMRALLLDVELAPTGPIDYAPCDPCDMPCRRACPQNAFKDGSYSRALCMEQMKKDETNRAIAKGEGKRDLPSTYIIKYCRACELACPVGK